jgi:hypothetical protein
MKNSKNGTDVFGQVKTNMENCIGVRISEFSGFN